MENWLEVLRKVLDLLERHPVKMGGLMGVLAVIAVGYFNRGVGAKLDLNLKLEVGSSGQASSSLTTKQR